MRLDDGETITRQEHREIVLLAAHPKLAATWSRYGPGERGPDLHVHREHTDAFYVLDGELTFLVGPGGDRVRAAPGSFVAVPRNVVHTFINAGTADARWLNFHAADGGFAAYLRAVAEGDDAPWDSFDPPGDGGRPASAAVVSPAGEGEHAESAGGTGLLRAALPDLRVTELALDASFQGPGSSPPTATSTRTSRSTRGSCTCARRARPDARWRRALTRCTVAPWVGAL